MLQVAFRSVQQAMPALSRLNLASKPNVARPHLDILKRSPSAYALFYRHKFEEKPYEGKVTDFVKTLGPQWKALSPNEKKPFIKQAEKMKLERQRNLEALSEKKLEVLRQQAIQERQVRHNKRLMRTVNKAVMRTHAPKKALTPYFIFLQEERKKIGPIERKELIANSIALASKWRNLEPEAKMLYVKANERLESKLPEVVKAWQMKMAKEFDEKDMYTAMQHPRMKHLILQGQKIPDLYKLKFYKTKDVPKAEKRAKSEPKKPSKTKEKK